MQKFNLRKCGALFLILVLAAVIVVLIVGRYKKPEAKKKLNLLCWVGYEEREMLEPFENPSWKRSVKFVQKYC
jgi:spermidine/putrescine-binding protein